MTLPPVLLLVDPRTGQVLRTAQVGAVPEADGGQLLGLEASPDGSRIAVTAIANATRDVDVVVFDAGLTPVGEPAHLGTAAGSGNPFGFAVADDGTVVAAPLEGLVELRPGRSTPRKVNDEVALSFAVVVTGRSAWVLYEPLTPPFPTPRNAPRGLHRYDLSDGRDTGSAEPCGDAPLVAADLARSADGGSVYAAVTCHSGEHRLLVFS